MGLPSAKRKSDKTQIGLFIGGEVFHFGGDYDIIKTKICTRQYRIILSAAAAVSALIAIFKNKANSRRNGTSLSSQKAKLSEKHIVSRSEEHPGSVP